MVCMNMSPTLKKPRIKEIDHVFLDSLERWIEVPVFEEGDLSFITSQVDWSKQTLLDYKALLVDHIDLEPNIRASLRLPDVRNEVYDYIVTKNPGLQPEFALESGHEPYYTEQEKSIMEWFSSHKLKGKRPEVIGDGGKE